MGILEWSKTWLLLVQELLTGWPFQNPFEKHNPPRFLEMRSRSIHIRWPFTVSYTLQNMHTWPGSINLTIHSLICPVPRQVSPALNCFPWRVRILRTTALTQHSAISCACVIIVQGHRRTEGSSLDVWQIVAPDQTVQRFTHILRLNKKGYILILVGELHLAVLKRGAKMQCNCLLSSLERQHFFEI